MTAKRGSKATHRTTNGVRPRPPSHQYHHPRSDDGTAFMVLEYLEGRDLGALIAS